MLCCYRASRQTHTCCRAIATTKRSHTQYRHTHNNTRYDNIHRINSNTSRARVIYITRLRQPYNLRHSKGFSSNSSNNNPPPSSSPRLSAVVSHVSEVANPRLFIPPSSISDAGQLITDPQQHVLITQLIDSLPIEVAIVTLSSVNSINNEQIDTEEESDLHAFAVQLFNHWRIGSTQKNDGLLILLITGAGRIEIVSGVGLEAKHGIDGDFIRHTMLEEHMIPLCKQKQFGQAFIQALNMLQQKTQQQRGTNMQNTNATTTPTSASTTTRTTTRQWWMTSIAALMAGWIFWQTLRQRTTDQQMEENMSNSSSRRQCEKCKGPLTLIGIVDRHNIRYPHALSPSDIRTGNRDDYMSNSTTDVQQTGNSDTIDSSDVTIDTSVNLYKPDYSLDYVDMVQSLSPEQQAAVQSGHKWFEMFVCEECGALYVQEREGDNGREGDGLADDERRRRMELEEKEREYREPRLQTPMIIPPPAPSSWSASTMHRDGSSTAPSSSTEENIQAQPRTPRRPITYLPVLTTNQTASAQRLNEASASDSSTHSGWGGGRSAGGGAGASF